MRQRVRSFVWRGPTWSAWSWTEPSTSRMRATRALTRAAGSLAPPGPNTRSSCTRADSPALRTVTRTSDVAPSTASTSSSEGPPPRAVAAGPSRGSRALVRCSRVSRRVMLARRTRPFSSPARRRAILRRTRSCRAARSGAGGMPAAPTAPAEPPVGSGRVLWVGMSVETEPPVRSADPNPAGCSSCRRSACARAWSTTSASTD